MIMTCQQLTTRLYASFMLASYLRQAEGRVIMLIGWCIDRRGGVAIGNE